MDESFETGPTLSDNQAEAPSAPVEQGQGADQVEYFSENFDPGSLDETLQPAYKQMQGAFTKKTQALAEERKALEAQIAEAQEHREFIEALQQDPETQRALYEQLAELADTWGEAEDEFEGIDPEVANLLRAQAETQQKLEQMEQERQTERQQALNMHALDSDLSEITKLRNGTPLDDEELELLGQFIQPDENGVLRALPAYQAMNKWFEKRQKQWIDGKQAPAPPGQGQQGSRQFDFKDPDARRRRMAAILTRGD
jgi:hypothetical protein